MTALKFSLDLTSLNAKLKQLESSMQGEVALRAVTAGATVIEAQAKLSLDKHGLRSPQSTLMNSVKVYDRRVTKHSADCKVGSRGVIYARIHEFGGPIRAKRVKNLAIPVTKEARQIGSPRDFSKTRPLTFIRSRSGVGGVMIEMPKGNKGKGILQYVLKPMVRIPARPYLRPAIDEHQSEIVRAMSYQLDAAIKKAAK